METPARVPPVAPNAPVAEGRRAWSVFGGMGAMWAGIMLTEQLSSHLLPLTTQRHTTNALAIGLILAINSIFGFTVQPWVAWWSDRVWVAGRRRTIFLLVGAPLVALPLWFLPEATSLVTFVGGVILFQFFQDVLCGAFHPLPIDLAPPTQRTALMGWLGGITSGITFLFLWLGLGGLFGSWGEDRIFRFVALVQLGLVMAAAWRMREAAPTLVRAAPPWTKVVRQFWRDRVLRSFGALSFILAFYQNVVTGFAVLFALQSLGMDRSDYGEAWSWHALSSTVLSLPAGIWVERRWHKGRSLAVGYALGVGVCLLGVLAHSRGMFVGIAVVFALSMVLIQVTQKAFFADFVPPDQVGMYLAGYQVCYAVGRSVAFCLGGGVALVAGNDFRAVWGLGVIACILAVAVALRLPDRRYVAR